METTETLDSINDGRSTTPGVYVWGKFTPDTEHVGFRELPLLDSPSLEATVAVDNGGETLTQVKLGVIASSTSSSVPLSTSINFNSVSDGSMYLFIKSTQGVTLNAPEDVTANWFMQIFKYDTMIMQIATKVENPRDQFIRSFINGAWTEWAYTYGSYHP